MIVLNNLGFSLHPVHGLNAPFLLSPDAVHFMPQGNFNAISMGFALEKDFQSIYHTDTNI